MLEQGISPHEILAITFTNKAAQEMRERVHNLVGNDAEKIWMYTFHSFGARFLRREIKGYSTYTDRFTIYDSDDSKQLIKNILKELNLDDKQYPPKSIQARISNAKNALQGPEDFRRETGGNFYSEKVAEIMHWISMIFFLLLQSFYPKKKYEAGGKTGLVIFLSMNTKIQIMHNT